MADIFASAPVLVGSSGFGTECVFCVNCAHHNMPASPTLPPSLFPPSHTFSVNGWVLIIIILQQKQYIKTVFMVQS